MSKVVSWLSDFFTSNAAKPSASGSGVFQLPTTDLVFSGASKKDDANDAGGTFVLSPDGTWVHDARTSSRDDVAVVLVTRTMRGSGTYELTPAGGCQFHIDTYDEKLQIQGDADSAAACKAAAREPHEREGQNFTIAGEVLAAGVLPSPFVDATMRREPAPDTPAAAAVATATSSSDQSPQLDAGAVDATITFKARNESDDGASHRSGTFVINPDGTWSHTVQLSHGRGTSRSLRNRSGSGSYLIAKGSYWFTIDLWESRGKPNSTEEDRTGQKFSVPAAAVNAGSLPSPFADLTLVRLPPEACM